jgi:hypothetical protein
MEHEKIDIDIYSRTCVWTDTFTEYCDVLPGNALVISGFRI